MFEVTDTVVKLDWSDRNLEAMPVDPFHVGYEATVSGRLARLRRAEERGDSSSPYIEQADLIPAALQLSQTHSARYLGTLGRVISEAVGLCHER